MNEITNTNGNSDILNEEDIRLYWNAIFKQEEFNEDETARIVFQAKAKPNTSVNSFEITENTPLRNATDLINYYKRKYQELPNHDIGISISSAVFIYDPTDLNEKGKVKAPSIRKFKKTVSLVFDIDAHIKNSKERFHIYSLEEDYIKTVYMRSYMEIMGVFKKHNIPYVYPEFFMTSGGGIQIGFSFDQELFIDNAKTIFGRFKDILGKRTFRTLVKDILGNFIEIELEIDPTFADISHTQRCAGIPNQKYNYTPSIQFSNSIDIFNFLDKSEENISNLKQSLKDILTRIDSSILESTYLDTTKKGFEDYYKTLFIEFNKLQEKEILLSIPSSVIIEDARIANAQKQMTINPNEYNGIEYDIILELKERIKNGFNIENLFPNINFESHGDYYKILCPFHEERTASMAFYPNGLMFVDFHDSERYNIIQFWEKLFEVNKATAISQIADKAGIKLNKSSRKDFEKMELEEIIETLIQKIDTENYVYYRLANKNRNCIVRHIPTGESFAFDGPKMLSSHVLNNQLKITDIDKEFMTLFQEEFEKKVLIEAFEEFHPGKPTVFQREFIKFVNMWVPSDNYKISQEAAKKQREEICPDGFDLYALNDFLLNNCPATYLYIQQMVQKGDIFWFLNWLASTAQFKVLPTIPVVFGIGGAGKNLFVSTILEWFLNQEYVKVLSGERVMSNFNSSMETASLLVLDEGDFSSGQQVDYLKLLTGNEKVIIEKKGVDAVTKQRFFNIIFFSNGEVPVRHPSQDRRIVYFNNEITLLELVNANNTSIDQFIELIKQELPTFWGALLNTKIDIPMSMSNNKDGLFFRQVLKMHPFGDLVIKLLEGEWEKIALQLNENVSDATVMKANLELLDTIKSQFENSGSISLTLINRYLQSLNYKYKTSIQKYIQANGFDKFGIDIVISDGEVKIEIDRLKLRKTLKISNVLLENNPKLAKKLGRVQKKISKMDPKEVIQESDKALAKEEADLAFPDPEIQPDIEGLPPIPT